MHQRDRPQRRGQDDVAGDHHGPHHAACRRGRARRPPPRRHAVLPPRVDWHRLRTAGARDLSFAVGARESRRRRAPGRMDARALLTNPTVLLMDEPTEGLAPVIVETLTAVLAELRADSALSIILVEQNSRVALTFSPRTVILDKGHIVYDGASEPLRTDPDRLAELIGMVE